MIIKLRRLFCLTQKKYLIPQIVVFCVVFSFVLVFKILKGLHFGVLIIPFLFSLCSIWHEIKDIPKKIEITDGVIKYTERSSYRIGVPIMGGLIRIGAGVRNHERYYKVSYVVWNVSSISFAQNKIERLFGVCHIEFIGEAWFDAGKFTERHEQEHRVKEKHIFYGVPCLDQVKKDISKQFPMAEIKTSNK